MKYSRSICIFFYRIFLIVQGSKLQTLVNKKKIFTSEAKNILEVLRSFANSILKELKLRKWNFIFKKDENGPKCSK